MKIPDLMVQRRVLQKARLESFSKKIPGCTLEFPDKSVSKKFWTGLEVFFKNLEFFFKNPWLTDPGRSQNHQLIDLKVFSNILKYLWVYDPRKTLTYFLKVHELMSFLLRNLRLKDLEESLIFSSKTHSLQEFRRGLDIFF